MLPELRLLFPAEACKFGGGSLANSKGKTLTNIYSFYGSFIFHINFSCIIITRKMPHCILDYSFSFIADLQSLALCSSSLAMVPKCTSSGPSAILNVLAVAHRCARTVSDDNPAAPCTCIAMSSTFSAMFGAATCNIQK